MHYYEQRETSDAQGQLVKIDVVSVRMKDCEEPSRESV